MGESSLRSIPSVDRVLRELGETGVPRPAVVALVRQVLERARERRTTEPSAVIDLARAAGDALRRAKIRPVINGTGIVVHTNLGRSPLGDEVVRSLAEIAANYNNLE